MVVFIDDVSKIANMKKANTDNLVKTVISGGDKLRDTTAIIKNIYDNISHVSEALNEISESTVELSTGVITSYSIHYTKLYE